MKHDSLNGGLRMFCPNAARKSVLRSSALRSRATRDKHIISVPTHAEAVTDLVLKQLVVMDTWRSKGVARVQR